MSRFPFAASCGGREAMGRKKRRAGDNAGMFCYYCDRNFENEEVLVNHQRAKHFKVGSH